MKDKQGHLWDRDMPHSFKTGRLYSVLLSSSTLHQWQGARTINRYKGDEIHVEQLTIPGATIEDVRHALDAEFKGTYVLQMYWRPCRGGPQWCTARKVKGADHRRLRQAPEHCARAGAGGRRGKQHCYCHNDYSTIDSSERRVSTAEDGGHQCRHNEHESRAAADQTSAPKFHTWGRKGDRSCLNHGSPSVGNFWMKSGKI